MQDGEVAAVAERAELRPLLFGRRLDQPQGFVGVAGEHDLIERIPAAAAVDDGRARRAPLDADRARSVTDASGKRKADANSRTRPRRR